MEFADAATLALELYRKPSLLRKFKNADLPPGVEVVLRNAASLENSAAADVQERRNSSIFFLQSVLLAQQSSDARLLGLTESYSAETLRLHKRLMLKWLHPDVNQNQWESQLFNRVLAAANRLEQKIKTPAEEPLKVVSKPIVSRRRGQMRFLDRRKRRGFPLMPFLKKLVGYVAICVFVIAVGIAVTQVLSRSPNSAAPSVEASN
jgi:hypothetical protein